MTSMSAPRPVLATGLPASNSQKVEILRRWIQSRLSRGALQEIAFITGKNLKRVEREIEGYSVFSVDVFVEALTKLSLEEQLRAVTFALQGTAVQPEAAPVAPIEEPAE